jgi:hypothetical protein
MLPRHYRYSSTRLNMRDFFNTLERFCNTLLSPTKTPVLRLLMCIKPVSKSKCQTSITR